MRLEKIMHGDCLEELKKLDDNSVDAIVTDPPYGLSFMGKKWDYDVPSEEIWKECLRVLKHGGYLLAFAGTRTQHRMAVRIEDAGFEIRDMIAWVYGCLSDDTEILTKNGWEQYHISNKNDNFTENEILIYDTENDIYKWERPKRWSEYNIHKDTAYRIKSDTTDQIVSRNHRCLIEREGKLIFKKAEELDKMELVPTMPNNFFNEVQREGDILQSSMQRSGKGQGVEKVGKNRFGNIELKISFERKYRREKSCLERWSNLYETKRKICESINKIRQVSEGIYFNGEKGWVCHGTQIESCETNTKRVVKDGMCSSHKSQRRRQSNREFNAIQEQFGTQKIRTRTSYRATLATIEPIEYSGVIFCPTVSTGAFVARRNGKIFLTGNSGFPKSLNVGKAVDALQGNEREVVGEIRAGSTAMGQNSGWNEHENKTIMDLTKGNSEWEGWGTALKPALEPITMARKPLSEKTVALNVLKWGTGGIDIDGSRIEGNSEFDDKRLNGNGDFATDKTAKNVYEGGYAGERISSSSLGRFPANFIHDGSDEVVDMFPHTKSGAMKKSYEYQNNGNSLGSPSGSTKQIHDSSEGNASRFFYCAKASKSERNAGCDGLVDKERVNYGGFHSEEGLLNNNRNPKNRNPNKNNHPTVKPISLMEYLVKLVSREGAIILDPFAGSGSTGVACKNTNRDYILIEREDDYIPIINARLKNAKPKIKPLSLF